MQVYGEGRLYRILQNLRMNYLQGSTSNTKLNESLSRLAWPPLRENYVSQTNRHEYRLADKFVRISAKELCMACYSVRTIKPFMCQENLKSVYCSYFHSLMTYGIIFWGNSTHSIHVFRLQRRVIRIITDSRPRDYCRKLFTKLGNLPLMSQCIFPLYYFL